MMSRGVSWPRLDVVMPVRPKVMSGNASQEELCFCFINPTGKSSATERWRLGLENQSKLCKDWENTRIYF